jgi:hypothetical protein
MMVLQELAKPWENRWGMTLAILLEKLLVL